MLFGNHFLCHSLSMMSVFQVLDELCIPGERHLTGKAVVSLTIVALLSTHCFGDNTVASKNSIIQLLLSVDGVRGGICVLGCILFLVMFG